MKYAFPLGLVVLLGVVASFHRSPAKAGGRPERPQSMPVRGEAAAPSWVEPPVARDAEPVRPTTPAQTAPAAKPASREPWRKMLSRLDQQMILTPVQRPTIEQILRERDEEIKACHLEIAKAGVVDIRRYDWQAGVMKDRWFRRIDALLDRAQHEQFLGLVQAGYLNEGLAFTVEPGMTVLD